MTATYKWMIAIREINMNIEDRAAVHVTATQITSPLRLHVNRERASCHRAGETAFSSMISDESEAEL